MREIVINAGFGGFGLSHEAVMMYAKVKGIKLYAWVDAATLKYSPDVTLENASIVHYTLVPKEEYDKFTEKWDAATLKQRQKMDDNMYFCEKDIERTDPALLEVVKTLGKKANSFCSSLKIIEIPNKVDWGIEDYDGSEHIAEKHRTWG